MGGSSCERGASVLDSAAGSTRKEAESVTHESGTEKASGRPERRRARQARDLVEHVLEPVRLGRDLDRAQRGARQLSAERAQRERSRESVRERERGTHVVEPGGEALVLLRLARVAGDGTDGLRASGRAHESVRVLAEVKESEGERATHVSPRDLAGGFAAAQLADRLEAAHDGPVSIEEKVESAAGTSGSERDREEEEERRTHISMSMRTTSIGVLSPLSPAESCA